MILGTIDLLHHFNPLVKCWSDWYWKSALSAFRRKKKDIIYKYQFVSRKGYSNEEAISVITENLNSAIDNKQNTCGIFLS